MFAKMVLPVPGGTPPVTTACSEYPTGVMHLDLVLIPFFLLPVALSDKPNSPSQEHPALWLLPHLDLTLGRPLFVVPATAPPVQTWFTRSNHSMALDP